jgi:hypothetical protein
MTQVRNALGEQTARRVSKQPIFPVVFDLFYLSDPLEESPTF